VAGRAFGQAKAHVGTAGRAGPGGTKAAVGAVNLAVLQQKVALWAGALPALRAGPHLAGVLGGAYRASEQDQAWFGGKYGGRSAALELEGLAALGAGIGGIQDAGLAGGAAPNKEQAAFRAEPGARCDGKRTAWAGKAEGLAAGGADLGILVFEGTAAARAEDLAAG